ncbi:MAG: diphthine synthase [Candidatus Bathyarchaeota archaeon]|nr:diphthine synthase [Candidatus Bathyarchaeota archaeon]
MNELVFVGIGLHDEKSLSLQALEEIKTADHVFIELYTNFLPHFSIKRLEEMVTKQIRIISRRNLEEENGALILEAAKAGKAVFLVPGDPFIATTHVTLRIEAAKRGIKTRIIHGPSVISAVIGLSGLHNYKFGKTVTVPFAENFSETPYNVIAQNKSLGLHTLCLLDLKVDEERFLSINEALKLLLQIEQKRKEDIITAETIAVGIARAGSNCPTLKADHVKTLLAYDFGGPPQSLIFPGELHFMEADALVLLAGAPKNLRGKTR